MMRYQLMTNCGQADYSTPLFVRKLNEKHNIFMANLMKCMREILGERVIYFWQEKEIELHIFRDMDYLVKGKPDLWYIVDNDGEEVNLVVEVTTGNTFYHLRGELSFYMMGALYQTSLPTFGFVIHSKGISYLDGEGAMKSLMTAFKIPSNPERGGEVIFKKKRWACSNCDFLQTCPVYNSH